MFEQFPSSSFQRESFFSKPTDNNATFESQLITPSSSDIDEGINNEEKYRRLFASDKHNSSLRDPHLNLINIMDNVSTFKYQSLTNEEDSIPSLLSKHKTQKVTGSSCVCTSIDKFKDNWNAFTENQFNGLNWNNLFVAGGAVLACLQPDFSTSLEVGNPFHSADIDIFIYGLSQSDATKKLKHVYEIVKKNTKCSTVIRSQYAITIIGQYPYRHTQIILRIYQSPAEVLMGFDIDCCGVGFDGKNVYALPRARRALTKQYNLVDLSRRSLTYEMRLHKYSTRGYEVKVPGMDASKISNNLYFNTIGNVNGLAKLLIFDNNQTKHYKVRKIKQPKGAPPPLKKRKDQESDYSNVSLPWGPNWILPTIINAINSQNQKSASSSNNNNDSKPEHIFITDIQGALSGRNRSNCICSVCKQGNSPPTTSDPVCGPLRWVTENPGRQILTGSFHPVNDNEWWNDAYRSWEQPENATLQINLPFKLPPRTKLVGVKPPKKKAVLKSIPAKSKPSIPAQPFTFQQNTTPPVKPQQGGTTLVFGRTPGLQEFMSQHSTPPSWGSTFTETVQPESDTAKLLLLVSKLCRDNLLTSDEKSQIKNLILRRNAAIISALEVFEIEKDFHELADSLKRICRREYIFFL